MSQRKKSKQRKSTGDAAPSQRTAPREPRRFSFPVWSFPACFALLTAVIAFNCFYHLGQLPALDWDEARHGVSGYEMLKSGNFLVNTYNGQPDYWNLKPPVSFWLIAAGYRLFGYSLFGMRFYSALAFLLTAVASGLFALRRYGRRASLAVLLLLACCQPFYRYHFARHGDADALFLLFAVLALFSAMLVRGNRNYFFACGLLLALAFLTKSWYVLPVLAVIGGYWLLSGEYRLLRPAGWCSFALCLFGPVLLWAAARYHFDGTKFLGAMVGTDLAARSSTVLEGHDGGVFYYVRILFSASPVAGWLLLCLGLYFGFLKATGTHGGGFPLDGALKKDLPLYVLWALLPLILFSAAKTKTTWYAVPLFFPVVLLGGLLFARVTQAGKKFAGPKAAFCVLLAVLAVSGYAGTWNAIQPLYSDSLENFFTQTLSADAGQLRGRSAYLVTDDPQAAGKWDQSYLLLGELALDLHCLDGGMNDFLSHPGSMLVIGTKEYGQRAAALQGCTVAARDGNYLCLVKN